MTTLETKLPMTNQAALQGLAGASGSPSTTQAALTAQKSVGDVDRIESQLRPGEPAPLIPSTTADERVRGLLNNPNTRGVGLALLYGGITASTFALGFTAELTYHEAPLFIKMLQGMLGLGLIGAPIMGVIDHLFPSSDA